MNTKKDLMAILLFGKKAQHTFKFYSCAFASTDCECCNNCTAINPI